MREMNRNLATAFVLLISLGCPAKSGAVDFAPPKTYPVGTSPSAVVVGDFNGDGKPDLAVANSGSNNVSILLGNGDGSFQPAVNFDAGLSPSSIAVGDFNGDGKLDLAVFQSGNTGNASGGALSILLGNGDGSFQAPKTTTLGVATDLAVGDFNLDHKADVAVTEYDGGSDSISVLILIGNGDGTFQPAKQSAVFSGGFPNINNSNAGLAAADFNNDAKPDLAIGFSAGVHLLLGKGDGTFQAGPTATIADGFVVFHSVQAGDVNGDGKVDLVVKSFSAFIRSPEGARGHTDHISLFLGNGNGTLQGERIVATANWGRANIFAPTIGTLIGPAVLGDFNGDGKLDVAYRRTTLPGSSTSLEILLARGDGTFSPAIGFGDPGSLATTQDLNADKLSDLVAVGASNHVAVLLNISPTSGADLGIIQSGASPDRFAAGDNLTYSASVLNEGPQDATGVTFTDTLPNGVNFVAATATQGSCVQSHGIVTCTLGSLASAFDAQVTIIAAPTAVGTITNSMSVTATEPDLNSANNTATQTSSVLPVYKLTVTKSGSGSGSVGATPGPSGTIDCGSSCSATYLSGALVNVNASPDARSFFGGWSGACSGTAACSVTMDADKTVTANFVLGATLSVTLAGTGSGSVTSNAGGISCTNVGGSCSAVFLPGTSVALTAVPSGNSTFANWSGACTGTDANACNVTLNSNQSISATFNIPPDFSVSPALTSLSVNRGGQVSETLTIGAQGGFSGTIALACSVSGPSPMPTCGISPNSVTPGNSATLTVNAAALAAAVTPQPFGRAGMLSAAWLPLGLLGCVLATGFDKKRRRMWALCLLMLATILPAACGGGISSPPPPVAQTFTVTVTATSGAIQHSTAISLTVR